jgi:hypothetical protein
MNSINSQGSAPDNDSLSHVEGQLRGITPHLEQLGLDAVQRERIITLTFVDISQELAFGSLPNVCKNGS